jgi:hypothetical protein
MVIREYCKRCDQKKLGTNTSAGFLCDCGYFNMNYDSIYTADGIEIYSDNNITYSNIIKIKKER